MLSEINLQEILFKQVYEAEYKYKSCVNDSGDSELKNVLMHSYLTLYQVITAAELEYAYVQWKVKNGKL